MIAALFFDGPCRWRSRQFSATLSFPPMNHFANGAFHSSTRFHFLRQSSSRARPPQNFSGLRIDFFQSERYSSMLDTCAFFANSFAGLKTRFSTWCDSIFIEIAGDAGADEGDFFFFLTDMAGRDGNWERRRWPGDLRARANERAENNNAAP